jgi:Rab-GTPase-TBC domain
MRDLSRTFPKHDYYIEGSRGLKKLERVLTAFANYDKQVGMIYFVLFL